MNDSGWEITQQLDTKIREILNDTHKKPRERVNDMFELLKKEKKISKIAIANKAKVSKQTMTNLTDMKRTQSLNTLLSIINTLDLSSSTKITFIRLYSNEYADNLEVLLTTPNISNSYSENTEMA